MKLRHATPARNLESIRQQGLLTKKSKGRLAAVWLHTPSRSHWAILHTMRRHGCKDVAVIEVDVPRQWLTRSKTGLWYCGLDVPPDRIRQIVAVDQD